MTTEEYENLIRRLKILSKAQTSFLKFYLQTKLSAGASLVSRALVKIRHLRREDPSLTEIESGLASLKLDELEVDYENTEIMLREELSTLKNAVYGTAGVDISIPVPPASRTVGPDTADSEQLQFLDADNKQLRSLLAEAKSEILSKDKRIAGLVAEASSIVSPSPPVPPTDNKSSTSDQEILSLRQSISDLEAKSNLLETANARLEAQLAAKDADVTRLKAQNESLLAQLSGTSAGAASGAIELEKLRAEIEEHRQALVRAQEEAERKLKQRTDSLNEEHQKRINYLEAKREAEKEELMEAMAQEVEAVEKKYTLEGESTSKEKKKLQKQNAKLQAYKAKTSSGLGEVRGKFATLKSTHVVFAADVRKQMGEFKAALKEQLGFSVLAKLKDFDSHMDELRKKYRRELLERKKLHNQIQELKGNIRVFMRSRPPSEKEIEMHGADSLCVTFLEDNKVRLLTDKGREKEFEFDEVFGLEATQEQVYAEVSPLVTSVLDGYNVCIFAYGQTGSGKTFTMNGPPDNRGVNTRALDELFTRCQSRRGEWNDSIMVSILEVYNEVIRDLLVPNGGEDKYVYTEGGGSFIIDKLEIRQGEFGNHVPGLTTVPVSSLSDVEQLMETADRNRSQSSTDMNEHSSRSHMMLAVTLTCENLISGQVYRGKLNLVDLAGSERVNKSGAVGQAFKEATNINSSLSALGDVIAARASKAGHIPFRNSTLTHLLQDSLSQDSKTLMFVCISPVLYNAEESTNSLMFASRVRKVELGKAEKNKVVAGGAGAPGGKPGSSSKSIGGAKKK